MNDPVGYTSDDYQRVIAQRLAAVQQLRDEHGFRATTLPADIALLGLVDDVIDAVGATADLLPGSRPHRALALLRTAFEGAQRVLVLATEDDYVVAGVRAWTYYQRKERQTLARGSPIDADAWLEHRLSEMTRVWQPYFPDAARVLAEANDGLKQQRGPDNFIGRDLANELVGRYAKAATVLGGTAPDEAESMNRGVYAWLSREAHARIQLEPRSLRIDSDGHVDVASVERSPHKVRETLVVGIFGVLGDAEIGLRYRLIRRRAEHAAALAASITASTTALPDNFLPDLGLGLLRSGDGARSHVFLAVPVLIVTELVSNTFTTSLSLRHGERDYEATFDFKGAARDALAAILGSDNPAWRPIGGPDVVRRLDLESPLFVDITASLGTKHQTKDEMFVPLFVTRVEASRSDT